MINRFFFVGQGGKLEKNFSEKFTQNSTHHLLSRTFSSSGHLSTTATKSSTKETSATKKRLKFIQGEKFKSIESHDKLKTNSPDVTSKKTKNKKKLNTTKMIAEVTKNKVLYDSRRAMIKSSITAKKIQFQNKSELLNSSNSVLLTQIKDILSDTKEILADIEKGAISSDSRQIIAFNSMMTKVNLLIKEIVLSRGDNAKQLEAVARIDYDELEKLIKITQDTANNKLTHFATISTILSLIAAVIIFIYQDQNQKEEAEKSEQIKAVEAQKEVARIDFKLKNLEEKCASYEQTENELNNKLLYIEEDKGMYWDSIESNSITMQLKRNELEKLRGQLHELKSRALFYVSKNKLTPLEDAITILEREIALLQSENIKLLKQYDESFYKGGVCEKERTINRRKYEVTKHEIENLHNFVKSQAEIAAEDEKVQQSRKKGFLASRVYGVFSILNAKEDGIAGEEEMAAKKEDTNSYKQ